MFVFLSLIIRDDSCLRFIPQWEMFIKLAGHVQPIRAIDGKFLPITHYSSLTLPCLSYTPIQT